MKKGVLFPDIEQALIDCNLIKSQADAMLQIIRLCNDDCNIKADVSFLRTFRELNKGTVSKGRLKKSIKIFFNKIDLDLGVISLIKYLSDFRSTAQNYKIIKAAIYSIYKETNRKEFKDLQIYINNYCEIEKELFKSKSNVKAVRVIKDNFYIDELSLEEEVHNFSKNKKIIFVFKIIELHQFLFIFSLIEQFLYIMFLEGLSKKQLERRDIIINLLPSIDSNGKYTGSVSKLIQNIALGMGCKSQTQFCKLLCRDGVDEDTIKKRLDRWKNASSRITPRAINTLLGNDNRIPSEIVFIASLIDIKAKDLMKIGVSKKFIVTEFERYTAYQSRIIEDIGSPS